jgi:Holliday junction resolvase RusA-like endonuclease
MSKLSDVDNPLKPFLDILQKKYKINDRDIEQLQVRKVVVKKGGEFIRFGINEEARNNVGEPIKVIQ